MVKKTKNTAKIATYGALLAVFSGAITTPVAAATTGGAENVRAEAVNNSVKTEATTKSDSSISAKPASTINGITWGDMSYSGSAANGLQVNNGVTSGELSFKLDISSLAGVNLFDKTYFRVKLPEEFRALAQTSAFRNAIRGTFRTQNFAGIFNNEYSYSSSDIRVDTASNEIIFTNRPVTNIELLSKTTLDMTINLGQAINESGVRIADSSDGYYHEQSALSQSGDIIDWTIGNRESKVDIPLRVMDPGAATPDNTRPEINVSAKNTNVSLNSKFDNAKALEGVTAYDKEDGDITRKIIVTSNTVDTSKPGYYVVSYSVTDSKGLEAQASTMIHVIDDAKDYALTANSYQMGSKEITGTYGKDVAKVDISVNGEVKAHAILNNGKFTVADADKIVTDKNQFVEAIALDKEGKEQTRKTVTVTGEVHKDWSLTPDTYVLGTKTITGTYGKDVEKVQLYIDGEFVETATLNNGRFTLDNAEYFVKSKDQKVNVIAVGDGFQQTVKPVIIVGDEDKDYSLAANSYKIGSSSLTGTYGKDITQVDVSVNGQIKASASLNSGNFTLYNANKFIADKNQFVEVIGRDKDGKEQARKTVILTGEVQKDYSLSANSYKIGSDTLTGKLGADIKYVRLSVDGKIKKQADVTVGSDGTRTFKFKGLAGAKIITSKDQKVEVVGVDKQYIEHARKAVTVTGDDIKDYSITPNSYKIGSETLTGKVGADVKYIRLFVDGQVKRPGTITTDKDGNKTFTVTGLAGTGIITNKNQKVEVIAKDKNYVEHTRKTVTVTGDDITNDYSLTANTYNLGTSTLTGTYGANVNRVRLVVNGQTVAKATLNATNHTYQFVGVDGFVTENEDQIVVKADDSQFHEVNSVNVNWTAKGLSGLINKDDKVEVVGVDKQYKEKAIVNVLTENPNLDYSLTAPNSFEIGKTNVLQGTWGKDIKAVRLLVNGEVRKNGDLDTSNHTYTLKGLLYVDIKPGDKVEVVGYGDGYKEVVSKTLNVIG